MLIVSELWMLTMKTKIVAMVLIAVLSLAGAVIAAWIVQPTEQTLESSPEVSVEELDQTVPSIASREQPIGEYAEVLVTQIGRVEVADFQAAGYANAEIRRFMLDNPRLFSRNRY